MNFDLKTFNGWDFTSVLTGRKGHAGEQGARGIQGTTGRGGPTGPSGFTGPAGPFGPVGPVVKGPSAAPEFFIISPDDPNVGLDFTGNTVYLGKASDLYERVWHYICGSPQTMDKSEYDQQVAVQQPVTIYGYGTPERYRLFGHIYCGGFFTQPSSTYKRTSSYGTYDKEFDFEVTPETGIINLGGIDGYYWYSHLEYNPATMNFTYGQASFRVRGVRFDANHFVCGNIVGSRPDAHGKTELITSAGVADAYCQLIDRIGEAKGLTPQQIAEMKAIYGIR